MGDPTTSVEQQQLETGAKRFEDINGELQGMLKQLLGELENQRDGWQGAGGQTIENVKVAWTDNAKALNRNLLETAEALRTSGQTYAIVDTHASDAMNKFRDLPLG